MRLPRLPCLVSWLGQLVNGDFPPENTKLTQTLPIRSLVKLSVCYLCHGIITWDVGIITYYNLLKCTQMRIPASVTNVLSSATALPQWQHGKQHEVIRQVIKPILTLKESNGPLKYGMHKLLLLIW